MAEPASETRVQLNLRSKKKQRLMQTNPLSTRNGFEFHECRVGRRHVASKNSFGGLT